MIIPKAIDNIGGDMMEIRNLTTFLAVSEVLNFTKVAHDNGYTQSAITVQIHQLEEEIGIKLFDRIGKKVTLTNEGKQFIKHARKIINEVEEAKNVFFESPTQRGYIKLGIVESLLSAEFPKVLQLFHKEFPNVSISIQTGTMEYLIEQLQHNKLDMMYGFDEQIYHEDWVKVLNISEKVAFVASSNHPLVSKSNVTIEEMENYDIILTEKDVSYRYVLERKLAERQKNIYPFLEVGNIEFIKRLLLENLGICYMPLYTIKKELREEKLSQISCKEYEIEIYKQLIYRKDKWLNFSMKGLIKIILECEKTDKDE